MRALKTLKKFYEEESHVVITEKGSPPRTIFSGEDFLLEDLPIGTRAIFPRPPVDGVPNLQPAIRWAVTRRAGAPSSKAPIRWASDQQEGRGPLDARLKPRMKLTIALGDISLPLPPM